MLNMDTDTNRDTVTVTDKDTGMNTEMDSYMDTDTFMDINIQTLALGDKPI